MQMAKKNPVIHRKKLFKGRMTSEEVHWSAGARRCMCGAPPVIKVRMLALTKDIKKQSPEYWAAIVSDCMQRNGTRPDGTVNVPTVATKYGAMICFSQEVACIHHRKELELAAASAPSWVLVEIDRGPGADNPIVQVPRGQA